MKPLVTCAGLGLALALPTTALAAPVSVTGNPVAATPSAPGSGLCVASSVSTSPATDFPQTAAAFDTGMNAFIDGNAANRTAGVLTTLFDLSNDQDTGPKISWGDFTGAVSSCPTGGCPFFVNDTTTSFGSRYRGYLAVTAAQAGVALHFGLYADDAVSLTIFDASGTAYAVLTQPPVLGSSTWRMTNTVTFAKAGLYPVEILYAQIAEHAALELSTLVGAFTDFQQPASQVPVTSLSTAGFSLVAPAAIYQTESGETAASDPTMCEQCVRSTGTCAAGSYCNAAALCVRCDVAGHCGATCMACATGESCVTGQCVGGVGDASADGATADGAVLDAGTPGDANEGDSATHGDGGEMGDAAEDLDARTSQDGATSPDATTTPDASTAPSPTSTASSSGGCGCHTAGRQPRPFGVAAAFALGCVWLARRRRRRRAPGRVTSLDDTDEKIPSG
jgi:outer membrane exchange protein TraA